MADRSRTFMGMRKRGKGMVLSSGAISGYGSQAWGYNSPLTEGVGGPSLLSLFANGEDGFLFGNWSELDELFTTAAAVSQVASDSDPVGVALDDHSWGVNNYAQQLALQPNLFTDDFTSVGVTGGSKVSGIADPLGGTGAIRVTSAAADCFVGFQSNGAVVTGKGYETGIWMRADSALSVNIYSQSSGVVASKTCSLTTAWQFFELPLSVAVTTAMALQVGGANSFSTGEVIDVYAPQIKLVPGNQAAQATSTKRPLWRANGGKPYLSFDGSDDLLVTPFNPTSSLTLAAAVRVTASLADQYVMGGGETAAIARAYLGVQGTTNLARAVWGSTSLFGAADVSGADHVLLVTGNASTVSLWVDGTKVATATPTGAPGGSTGPLAVGGLNPNGTPSTWFAGRDYANLALNRVVTDAEVASITSYFQRTYQ